MAKVYKKEIDLFVSHKNEKGEDVFYTGQIVLQQLLSFLNININALSKEIGWTRPDSLYRVRDGLTKTISGEVAADIYRRYKWVDIFWLITGEGEMVKKEVAEKDITEGGVNSDQQDQNRSPVLRRLLSVQDQLREAIKELKASQNHPTSRKEGMEKIRQVRDKLKDTGSKTGTIGPG